jgi:hypothetical protein
MKKLDADNIKKIIFNPQKLILSDNDDIHSFEPQEMVSWYHIPQLAATGIRSVVSTLFGSFADKREIMGTLASNKDENFDYSNQDEIWVDYMSDLGDGFDSTYTMAHLISRDSIEIDNNILARAKILILGGDQVYPTATREEYKNRFKGPYQMAFPFDAISDHPHLYAVPGNHDWYDGLTNFLKIFCQQRFIGNWLTRQTRSYFAIQLPHDWWIWSIDIQLEADIDQLQLEYFESIKEKMNKGSKVIICTAEPSWVFFANGTNSGYKSLQYFENRFLNDPAKPFEYALTLTGDLHHYSRYECVDKNQKVQKITSGGGGAFLHPTHNLPNKIKNIRESDIELKKTYPAKEGSRRLLFKNFLFIWNNKTFSIYIGAIFLLIAWIIQSKSYGTLNTTFIDYISDIEWGNFTQFFTEIGRLYINNLILFAFNILLVIFMYHIANIPTNLKYKPYVYGIFSALHGFVQIVVFYFVLWFVSHLHSGLPKPIDKLILQLLILIVGGITVSTIFGIHLILSNLFLGNHDNESFSSLKYEGYKNFLRMNITKNSITIYPIGINKICDWKVDVNKMSASTNDKLEPMLIEPPIKIDFNKHD